ncbi:MAG: DUF11 domain-containing protein [Verrucomicrobia bacterium]|nr:DUF11 domain-containing protein [Verrucomicrobiota bacterium]
MNQSFPNALLALLWLVTGTLAHALPTITGFTPTSGGPGTTVTITGTDLSTASQVKFGNSPTAASFNPPSATQITAVVPVDALTGPISVTVSAGSLSSSGTFTVSPRVDSFSPAIGNIGTLVTIFGANFISGQTTVRFGSVQAAAPSVTAANQLVATVPAGAVTSPISVSTFAGTNTTPTNFVISGTAIITGFTPTLGPTGSVVIISGGDFTGATAVKFNGTNAAGFTVTAASQISATVQAAASTGPISITTPNGTVTSSSNFVVSGLAPIVTGFSPIGGKAGDPVVITGINFTTATNVTFNGITAVGSVTSDTQISATVPTGATTGPIRVINPAGTNATGSNFIIGPFITGFSPVAAQVGSQVVVEGLNFLDVTNVAFTAAAGGFTNASVIAIVAATQLRATVPAGATNGPIRITSPSGTNVTSSNLTVFALAPVITGFTPTNGLPGSTVTLDGANFLGTTNVSFNGVPATTFNVSADTQITATVPATATTGPISVSTSGGSVTSSVSFYLPPRLTSFSPATGVVGISVTLAGTNFTGVTSVTFAGANATLVSAPVTSLVATQMTVLLPTNAVTGVITVTTPGGVITSPGNFTVTPRVDSFTPLLGPVGTAVTVRGHSFTNATAVRFNGVSAGFSSVTDTQLVAVIPAGAGTGPLTVVTPDGTGTAPVNYVVTTNPDLTTLQTNSPTIVFFGSNVTLTITVTNSRSSIATGVTLTDTLPAGYTFVSATSSQGTPTFAGGVVTCPIGAVTNGQAVTVTIIATAAVNGLAENRVNLTLSEGDFNPADNFGSHYFAVVTDAERMLTFEFLSTTRQFTILWPPSAANFKLESNTNLLTSGNVWTVVPETIQQRTNQAGVVLQNFVVHDTSPPRKFYRLRAP